MEGAMKVLNRPVFQYAYYVNDIDTAAMNGVR